MALSSERAYTATKVLLELDGELAGSLSAAEGGDVYADVVSEAPENNRIKKSLGAVRYAPVTITFGAGIGQRLFDWVAGTLAGNQPARDGALVFLDYQSRESSRLEFQEARISEIELPLLALLVAQDKGPADWTVTFQAESTAISRASAGTSYASGSMKGGQQKRWSASSFRFRLSGLEQACTKVSKVEPLVVRQPADPGSPPEVGPLVITVPNAFVQPFQAWHEDFVVDGNNTDDEERSGQLALLTQNLQDDLCTVTLANVGIVRIRPERLEGESQVLARSTVELYVEGVELAQAALADAAPAAAAPAEPADASELVRLAEAITTAVASREPRQPVAARFAATAADDRRAREPSLRSDGMVAGETWARATASLPELQAFAALADGDWTDLRLSHEHSLAEHLRAAGTLDADLGAVDLGRDDFVEGLVAGAAEVYRDVLPVVLEGQDSLVPSTIASLDDIGDETAAVDLQMILQEQQQVLQILSNVSKTLHDTAQSVIHKLP